MTQDEKEQILQKFLETVEYRNYIQKHTPSGSTVYDFQLQTLLSVIAMTIDNKDIPEGLKKVYEAIMSYKDRFLSINNSVDAINNNDVVDAINSISFDDIIASIMSYKNRLLSINNSIDAINNDDVVDAINDISFDDVVASIEELYDRTDNLEKGQQATIQSLSNIVDKMNKQQNINVQAFKDICDKLDKIVENTSPNEPEPQPQPEPKQATGYETLMVKSTENGISSVGGWYIKPYTRQLETAYGELKIEGSKKVIPTKNAEITTTIKYTDGRTNKLKTWNGGFEYISLPKTVKGSSTAQTKTTTKVQKGASSSAILNKSKESNGTTKSNAAPIVWDLRKPIKKEEPKTTETKCTVYRYDFKTDWKRKYKWGGLHEAKYKD